MSGFGDDIYQALTGSRPDAGPPDLESAIRELVHIRTAEGMSRRAFAREYGIPESTLRRVEQGGTHSEKGRAAVYNRLMGAWRQASLRPGVAERWRADNMSVTLANFPSGGGRRGRGTETRTVTAAKLDLRPGTGDKVVDAVLRGDKREAAREMVRGIGDPFYKTVFTDWIGPHDEDLAGMESEGGYDTVSDYALTVSVS